MIGYCGGLRELETTPGSQPGIKQSYPCKKVNSAINLRSGLTGEFFSPLESLMRPQFWSISGLQSLKPLKKVIQLSYIS